MNPGVRFGDSGVIPDVVLANVPADDTVWLDPADVLVLVEVLSPSTKDRDLGRKRGL